jgi:hypothetical protein
MASFHESEYHTDTGQGMNHAFRHLQPVATDPSVTDALIGSTV